jgi:polar amino acid transport system substrate-binding protein
MHGFLRHTLLPLILLAICLTLGGRPAGAEEMPELTYLTEEYFPFNYTDGDRVKGVSTDLLRLIWTRLGLPKQPIRVMPWARAYERIRHQPGTVLFSMARTPEREDLFRWVGPIMTVRFALFAKKDKNITLTDLDQMKGYSVGILREDISDAILTPYASSNSIEPVADMRQNVLKLKEDRLDMVAYEEFCWPRLVTRLGLDPEDFETVFVLRETPVYYAFHRDTPPETVDAFQQALDSIKNTPAYPHILSLYMR